MAKTFGRMRAAALLTVAAGGLALASCMTATPYQPATGAGSYRTGFSDERIESDRFRVSFAGNSLTSRDTVERYLLFRAAEITLESGNDHFILVERDTEKRTNTYVTPGLSRPGPWGYWSPYWRYSRGRFGWRSWNPFYDDPFWDRDVDIRTVDRYEAMAEIVVGKGRKPDNVRAFNAREVVDRLGPTIQMPSAR